jgi:hypothetical protein
MDRAGLDQSKYFPFGRIRDQCQHIRRDKIGIASAERAIRGHDLPALFQYHRLLDLERDLSFFGHLNVLASPKY